MKLKLLNFNEKKHFLEHFRFKFIHYFHFSNKTKSLVFACEIKYIILLYNFYYIISAKTNNTLRKSQF